MAEDEPPGLDDISHIGEHLIVLIQVAVTQTVVQSMSARVAIVKGDQFCDVDH
jgi:hypothetical protein